MMVTPATQTSHALDDDRWFSIADLVREKIRTSFVDLLIVFCFNVLQSYIP